MTPIAHGGEMQKSAATVTFEPKPLKVGEGWLIVVTYAGGIQQHIPGFHTEAETKEWLAGKGGRTHTAAMAVLAKLDAAFGTERRVAAFGSAAARLLRAYATQVDRVNVFCAFSRAREAEPSAAWRILAELWVGPPVFLFAEFAGGRWRRRRWPRRSS